MEQLRDNSINAIAGIKPMNIKNADLSLQKKCRLCI